MAENVNICCTKCDHTDDNDVDVWSVRMIAHMSYTAKRQHRVPMKLPSFQMLWHEKKQKTPRLSHHALLKTSRPDNNHRT